MMIVNDRLSDLVDPNTGYPQVGESQHQTAAFKKVTLL